ncbi:CHRD domain-containing protein [Dyadobacter sp. CY312]|uniref:CHRD domain-containing protein n=1 Tax=Dyadobacter sp. CY312 TaxID=2907303 RepID=UPI001F449792|nr:CHRD domain-containing protein [Dyadobacter sp. CY312]MCE7039117.1 CHRD domain-containing protein [Dyadobacter sp. CY312]
MKKPMKRFLLFMTGIAMLGSISSCKEEGPHKEDIVKFSAAINVQPAVGTGAFEYNKNTKELTYNISYSGVTPSAVNINIADPGWERGSSLFVLPGFTASQVSGKTRVLSNTEVNNLLSGMLYVNITTAADPLKEYRGQILPVE